MDEERVERVADLMLEVEQREAEANREQYDREVEAGGCVYEAGKPTRLAVARAVIARLDAEWGQRVAGAVEVLREVATNNNPGSRVNRAIAILAGAAEAQAVPGAEFIPIVLQDSERTVTVTLDWLEEPEKLRRLMDAIETAMGAAEAKCPRPLRRSVGGTWFCAQCGKAEVQGKRGWYCPTCDAGEEVAG